MKILGPMLERRLRLSRRSCSVLDRLVKQPGSREDNRLLLRNLKKKNMLVKSALNTNVLQKNCNIYC